MEIIHNKDLVVKSDDSYDDVIFKPCIIFDNETVKIKKTMNMNITREDYDKYEKEFELNKNKTLCARILQTEYEYYYVIVPFVDVKKFLIESMFMLNNSLSNKLDFTVLDSIKEQISTLSSPSIPSSPLSPSSPSSPSSPPNPRYLMNNTYDIKPFTKTSREVINNTYSKDYIKYMIINNNFFIGVKDHFIHKHTIKILNKKDSDDIIEYYKLSPEEKEQPIYRWIQYDLLN